MQTQLRESLEELRGAGAAGAGGSCPLLLLQYLILVFEFILLI